MKEYDTETIQYSGKEFGHGRFPILQKLHSVIYANEQKYRKREKIIRSFAVAY